MHEVWHHAHVGLGSAATGHVGEALVLRKSQEQQFDVVNGALVSNVPVGRGLGQVGVVPGQAGGEGRLHHTWAPQGKKAIAFGVRIL